MIELKEFNKQYEQEMLLLIQSFWQEHNNCEVSLMNAKLDLELYTSKNHCLYFIVNKNPQIV